MTFSGALKLTDLNDFITPSQACIKPVEQVLSPEESQPPLPGAASTQIQIDASGLYHEREVGTTKTKKLQKAEISLNDCLACSGCITSAESVLITMQSHLEVLSFLESNPLPPSPEHRIPVVSIAPQCLASLSATLLTPTPLRRVLRRVQAFCKQELGFRRAYDTTFARHLALQEHIREFMERKKGKAAENATELPLPMLSSACPGWVCYAEKTHAEMIPFMSRTKSPQQVMGTLVKSWMGQKWGTTPDQVYHVAVMPCYDKKLEASRTDFYSEVYATRDVDCVLTTGELETMMREKGWDLSQPVPGEDLHESTFYETDDTAIPELVQHPGTSSGSYLHSIITELSTPSSILSSKVIRTSDYEEFVLKDTESGEILFKGAKCYGFRNLQNVVRKVGRDAGVQTGRGAAAGAAAALGGRRKLRPGVSANKGAGGAGLEDSRGYDYVEVMACPSGCVNGGGQIRPPSNTVAMDAEGFSRDWSADGVATPVSSSSASVTTDAISTKWGDKAWTSRVEVAYWQADVLPTPPSSPPPPSAALPLSLADRGAKEVLADLTEGEGMELDAVRRKLFRTEYRAVETDSVVGLTVQW